MPERGEGLAVLRIKGDLGRVAAVVRALEAVESSYNGLYTFEAFTGASPFAYLAELGSWRPRALYWLPHRGGPTTAWVQRRHLLVLREAQFTSPGFWAVIGALNPLESIRKFLNDEHRRSQDRRYHSRLDEERMQEEVERLRLENVAERIRLLRELGVPEPVVRQIVIPLVVRPLRALEASQDSGFIATAELLEPDQSPEEEPEPPAPQAEP